MSRVQEFLLPPVAAARAAAPVSAKDEGLKEATPVRASSGWQSAEVKRPEVPAPPSLQSKLGFLVWTPGSNGDAGDYYCEHLLFVAEQFARAPDASIARNADRSPLVGFIHLPEKPNNQGTSRVIAAALSGYLETLRTAVPADEPIRVALTGFGTWGDARNPSGDFLTRDNLTAAMKLAFAGNLSGEPTVLTLPNGAGWSFQVGDREVQLLTRTLPVDNNALSGDKSVADFLKRTQPHGLIGLGQKPGGIHYQVESRADDGGLQHDKRVRHNDMFEARVTFPRNEALFRAINQGWRADW